MDVRKQRLSTLSVLIVIVTCFVGVDQALPTNSGEAADTRKGAQLGPYLGLTENEHDEVDELMTQVQHNLGIKSEKEYWQDELSDILLTPEQARYLKETSERRQKRKIQKVTDLYRRWELPIKWKFNKGAFGISERIAIRDSFNHWESQTCITFREYDEDEDIDGSFLLLDKSSSGCASYVGDVFFFRAQTIVLTSSCAQQSGATVHEIGHAIGFWHEHQRADRDSYVEIMDDNIKDGASKLNSIITKRNSIDDIKYDYGSIMHYHPYGFSKNGKRTIIPKNEDYEQTIGQKDGLSFFDSKAANFMYCTDTCSSVRLRRSCQNDGYQDPKNCSKCRCPDGFAGDYCDELAPSTASCGGIINLDNSGKRVNISSPDYGSRSYSLGLKCHWLVQAPKGYRVVLEMSKEKFGVFCETSCIHYLEVKYDKELITTGPRHCCSCPREWKVNSESRQALVIFSSKSSNQRTYVSFLSADRYGFTMDVYAERYPSIRDGPFDLSNASQGNWEWSCDFEEVSGDENASWCGLVQYDGDQFDWLRNKLKTRSSNTGPDRAASGEYYIYLEASHPRKLGDRAVIFYPRPLPEGTYCLTFKFQMHGVSTHMGDLKVVEKHVLSRSVRTLWVKKGETNIHASDQWVDAEYEFRAKPNYLIGLMGVRGSSYRGDMAVDSMQIVRGSCK